MSEEFTFIKGIVKSEDVKKLKRDMQDAIKGLQIVNYLDKEEPVLMLEAHRYAEKETRSFEGAVGLDSLPFLQFSIMRAVAYGFLIHKKANDRLWEGIDENSTI